MSQTSVYVLQTRRVSLSLYISILLIITAILMLAATISSIEIFLRPALIDQVSAEMKRDVQTRIQVIDTYLSERLNDIKTLSEATPLKNVLNGNHPDQNAALDVFFTAFHRDVADYISLSLLNKQGGVVLAYPTSPQAHGKYLVQPEASGPLETSSKVIISDVFYDPVANNPSVDLYARVVDARFHTLGTVRASLSLHRLWVPVDSEPQANGSGSYAFVLDQHGVRIAYTNPDHSGFTRPAELFKAVGPLSPDFQRRIKDENLYGNNIAEVSTIADTTLTKSHGASQPTIFQFSPVEENQTFQAASYTSTVVPWTYFLLKPFSFVTGLADQQLLTVIIIVSLVLVVAVAVGIQAGRLITVPIMRSVTTLRKNSLVLRSLASEEQTIATEQSWMVEASQMALESIKYYTNAMHVAGQRLAMVSADLRQTAGRSDPARFQRVLNEVAAAAAYIERAAQHQNLANEKLASAIRVTTQAATQLTNGANSTDEAAAQLEQIVQQLMAVVGDRSNPLEELPD